MEKETQKGALIEKITFAILPFLFSGLVYLLSALNDVRENIDTLENKVLVAVTPENAPRPNSVSELAREKLRQDFMEEHNESEIKRTELVGSIELLKWRITQLEEKNGSK
jgi:hypothetical protein